MNKSPGLIIANVNYVKKVIFPLEILPWVTMGSAIFHAAISMAVWLIFYCIFIGAPGWSALLLPVVLVPILLTAIGLSWLLAAIGTYVRDMLQFIGLLTTILMFLSPIFYPSSSLPKQYRELIVFNPLTIPVEQVREVLVWNRVPNGSALMWSTFAGIVIAWIGFASFQKARKGFADVL
jgi:lipopolysaccharide transport system permease protein